MIGRPDTMYAWNGDVCLAFQVAGDGALDLLYIQGYCSNVDLAWEGPRLSRFLRGLAGHGRLILTDRRGWGCSDRFSAHDVQDIDAYVDDLGIVLDAARSERAVIVASGESALLGCLFAAAHPSRTAGLVLIDAFPTYAWTSDTPWAPTPEQWRDAGVGIRDHWGTLKGTQTYDHCLSQRVRRIGPRSPGRFRPCSSRSRTYCCADWSNLSLAPPLI